MFKNTQAENLEVNSCDKILNRSFVKVDSLNFANFLARVCSFP